MRDLCERKNPSRSASSIADERDFGNVEPLAQKVYTDQHVEFSEAQVPDYFSAFRA